MVQKKQAKKELSVEERLVLCAPACTCRGGAHSWASDLRIAGRCLGSPCSDGAWRYPAIGAGIIDFDAVFQHLRAMGAPLSLAIEVPTRMTRDVHGTPTLSSRPTPLSVVRKLLADSTDYVNRHLTPSN